jgi:chemotaxis family two-component system response regulator Rcp1
MADDRQYLLLIEDNPADARLIQEALKDSGAQCAVEWLMNSREAIPFLRGIPDGRPKMPDLIVLDYKMPIDGGLALAELKGDPLYLHVPVIVLTGVHDPRDICEIYRRGANCCYHKPDVFEGWRQIARRISEHWLTEICSPRCQAPW